VRRLRLIGLLLALITLVAYLPVAHHGFSIFDDDDYVTNNPVVQDGLTWVGVKWAFTTWHASNWHPITWLSHMTDCELFGPNAGAHHLVNVLFHTANAVLLLLLLFRMTGALWPSAFVAALFAWHPLHVESVAWISERKDVLSTFFALLTLLAYTRYAWESKVRSPKSKVFYSLSLLAFALGLMAKPMLVTLPFVMLLLDYWPLQRLSLSAFRFPLFLRLALEKCPFFLLAAISCVVTFLAQRASAVLSLEQDPLNLRLVNTLLSYGRYLLKTIWPVDLAVIYPFPNPFPWGQGITAAVVLLAVSWSTWRTRRPCPYLLVGWLWFLGTLVPVIGLVQVGFQAMADRYAYIPLIGVFIAIAFAGKHLVSRFRLPKTVFALASGLALVGCLLVTERQLSYWQDDESLFRHAIAVTKNNATAHINLGVALERQNRRSEALIQYQEALRIAPDSVHAHNNLGNFLDEMGKPDEALAQYQEALRLKPDAPIVHDNLGTLLVELGKFDEALTQYAEAARLNPTDPRPYYLMGKAQLKRGDSAMAITRFHDALRLDPNDFQTLTYMARVLASDENPRVRNGQIALEMAVKANDLTGGEQPVILDILAMSYAETGRFQDAQQIEQRAIQLAQAAVLEETNAMLQRLELYKSDRPYRETFTNPSPQNIPKN
jgi:tetratricopeptide (TPR) repeat protein